MVTWSGPTPRLPGANRSGAAGNTTSDSTSSPQGASTLPAISLPKGGGAIRGIGEKFGTNPVTGTASLSVPIITTPGRANFSPQLSLEYDSGAGNGLFGFGWHLPLPSITRKTDKGLPRYEDADESDIFILSGAEDLVPVLVAKGEQWERDSFERSVGGVNYRIQRYRPRIEGMFARVERWTSLQTGETYWKSISKDNITTVYGQTANSRIADPDEPLHVFSWLIGESYDNRGNAIRYEYKAENSQRVDFSAPSEQNRTNTTRSANRYLKRIQYGNQTPRQPGEDLSQRADWLFEVVFDYGEHDTENDQGQPTVISITDDQRDWNIRQDAFSSYRAGFEVRTYRLCQRVLMFHHFPNELGVADYLVRSTEFVYQASPIASFVTQVVQSGYRLRADGTYLKKSLPPLEFEYSLPTVQEEVREIDAENLENLPQGLDGSEYQWVDLDGEGISGLLTEQGDAWFYKRNLSSLPIADSYVARFAPTERIDSVPSLADLSSGRQQLMDLGGDGQFDLVQFEPPLAGYFERDEDETWKGFKTFVSLPNLPWNDPNLKFVDLTGDGFADILITEDDVFTWYPSLAKAGFGPGEIVPQPSDEERGAHLVFADGAQSIYLADLSGDGLTDLVRIRNGEICYWPNLGYGRFGAKVTMNTAPWFDTPDQFDQRRIRLADIDGSGTTDILYLGRDGVDLYFNQSGNGWSGAHTLSHMPRTDNLSSVAVVDLLGNGTACLVWSSPLPGDAHRPMYYIDLMSGQKPHLLTRTINNLGAETWVQYAPSTKFYLADKIAGQPWITRLPFPVHVVEWVETYDRISRNCFVTRYAYHHGYFDGIEREFRGFGMIEQWDTEAFAALNASDTFPAVTNMDEASHIPPVLTRTWFHTGAHVDEDHISRQFEHEYYHESDLSLDLSGLTDAQIQAMLLDDTLLPADVLPDETPEASRALKGSILRREIYALDGTEAEDRPYSVSEQNYTIERLQPRGNNQHAVFFVHSREALDFHYERKLYDSGGHHVADPRVSHTMTLAVDDYGNVLQSVAVGYGRRFDDPDPLLRAEDRRKQQHTLITYTENNYTNAILQDEVYRAPLPCEIRTYELLKVVPSGNEPLVTNLFRFEEMVSRIQEVRDGLYDIPYEDVSGSGAQANHPYRRRIEHTRMVYRKDDLTGPLPLARLDSLALPFESYKLAFTPGLIDQIYGDRAAEDMLAHEGFYVHSEGDAHWWIPSGRVFYSVDTSDTPAEELTFARQHFFLPQRFQDPFGYSSATRYDPYDLLILETADGLQNKITSGERDALGNITNKNDYRVLQPALVTDPNRNRAAVAFDVLGLVVGTAVMGKMEENKGDSLAGFEPDLDDDGIQIKFQNPLVNPPDILKEATTRLVYDLFAYARTRADPEPQPNVVYTLARETHAVDLKPNEQTKIQHSFSYSDGFGREIQKKAQAEPGHVVNTPANPRWVGSGWTIFNNKGDPVRQYEPFFSADHHFEFAKTMGVSSTLFYDPVGRMVAAAHPNHAHEKVTFDPWQQVSWDVNDTVLQSDPKDDPDVGDFYKRLPTADYLPTWYAQRITGGWGVEEQDTAQKAAAHANTPTRTYFDVLGRPILVVLDNGAGGQYATRMEQDIEGNLRSMTDALGREVMAYAYDMLGTQVSQHSMDAGERWTLNDVIGKPIRAWDSRDHRMQHEYDELHRPTNFFVQTGGGAKKLVERLVYGESQPDPTALNLRGKVFQQFDAVGVITHSQYDFKGNFLNGTRQLLQDYRNQVDWNQPPAFENETYPSSTTYDALNRPLTITAPDGSLFSPTYNVANLLEQLSVNLRGSAASTPFVTNIGYNAKGQRDVIEYANGVTTTYSYDPLTFRLTHLLTRRDVTAFPDDCPPPSSTWPGCQVQNLSYTHDPAGNITHIRDEAQQAVFFRNQRVEPSTDYTYDAIYRLIRAEGREHIGQQTAPQTAANDGPRINLPHPGDGQAMRRYAEQYEYDAVGNLLEMIHQAANGGWTRSYAYDDPLTNRLTSTTVGAVTEPYTCDAHGNMITMPHLPIMEWDFKDQLHATRQQVVNEGTGEKTYYVYDAGGQRARKVTERPNGTRKEERIYLGGYELYRAYDGSGETAVLERETLHVTDDHQRIALVETRTIDTNAPPTALPDTLVRYQLENHLESASLELDDHAAVISYEEYYPYGSTSYQAMRSGVEVSQKRYRYTGKERDDETGLYYHGARYYAPWLGRWTSYDPVELVDGDNGFSYCSGNPIMLNDPTGNEEKKPETLAEYRASNAKRTNPLTDEQVVRQFHIDHPGKRSGGSQGGGQPGGTDKKNQPGNSNSGGDSPGNLVNSGNNNNITDNQPRPGNTGSGTKGDSGKTDLDYLVMLAKLLDFDPDSVKKRDGVKSGGIPDGIFDWRDPSQLGQIAYVALQSVSTLLSAVQSVASSAKELVVGEIKSVITAKVFDYGFNEFLDFYTAAFLDNRIAMNDGAYPPTQAAPNHYVTRAERWLDLARNPNSNLSKELRDFIIRHNGERVFSVFGLHLAHQPGQSNAQGYDYRAALPKTASDHISQHGYLRESSKGTKIKKPSNGRHIGTTKFRRPLPLP